jgi:uncharacterized DUF497 family protein
MKRNDWKLLEEYLERADFDEILEEKEGTLEFKVYPASPEILEKIEGFHRLPFAEVQQVFHNPDLPPYITPAREGRQMAIGESFSGRGVVVIFVEDEAGNIRVISARDQLNRGEATLLREHKRRR